MKKLLPVMLTLCCGALLFSAPMGESTPEGWYDNFAVARQKSKELNRPLLLLVTGSDWCPWCVRLKKDVLNKSEFKKFAAEKLVAVYVDLPRKIRLPSQLTRQNRELAKTYNPSGGVPVTVLLSPDGKELGRIEGYSKAYVEKIENIISGK